MALRIALFNDCNTTAPGRPVTDRQLYAACLAGDLPAELLPPGRRRLLLHELHALGWTDVEIATHTRMTTYTTARLRDQLGLDPNPSAEEAVA